MSDNLKPIKPYLLVTGDPPGFNDIKDCIAIARKENCVVQLIWSMKWSGTYDRYIYADDDPSEVMKNRIPHTYGV